MSSSTTTVHKRRGAVIGIASFLVVAIVSAVVAGVVVLRTSSRSKSKNSNNNKDNLTASDHLSNSSSSSLSSNATTSSAPAANLPPTSSPVVLTSSLIPTISPPPTLRPTLSKIPTEEPTALPTTEPSPHPTQLPSTLAPTSLRPTTIAPTPEFMPVNPNDKFTLRLHWKREYEWQDTTDEFNFCLECVDCREWTNSDEGEGCYDSNGRDNKKCRAGNQLWVQRCNNRRKPGSPRGNTEFNLLQGVIVDYIRIDNSDLCLTRVGRGNIKRFVTVETCDPTHQGQRWKKIRNLYDQPFDLRPPPAGSYDNNDNEWCLTQQHHPKPDEVFFMKDCREAYRYDTALFDAILDD